MTASQLISNLTDQQSFKVTHSIFMLPTGKTRATESGEKIARRDAILDAAASLYYRAQQLPNVSDVAAAAGLAKGTIYLYFETKEAICLALHARQALWFFEELIREIEQNAEFGQAQMIELVDRHLLSNPNYLPLSTVCLSAPADAFSEETHEQFHQQINAWLLKAGRALEEKFPALIERTQPSIPGIGGMRFLHHCYSLILGMYQLVGNQPAGTSNRAQCKPKFPEMSDFRNETISALVTYWKAATLSGIEPANRQKSPER